MNFDTTTTNFNLFLQTHGYNTSENTMYLLSKSYDVFLVATSYNNYVEKMLQYISECYNVENSQLEQCFNINGNVVLLPPTIFIDLLYGFYQIQLQLEMPENNTVLQLSQYDILSLTLSALQFCDYGITPTDFKKVISICDTYYDITEIQYDFIVWHLLQLYPYKSQKFTLSHFCDSLHNLDIVAARKLPYNLNNTLLNFGCYKNIHGVYIQLP